MNRTLRSPLCPPPPSTPPLTFPPSSSTNTSAPSPDKAHAPASALRGGPKTWPREVLAQVQALIEHGYGSSRICNHFTLQRYHLSTDQVDLVRALPTTRGPHIITVESTKRSPPRNPSELPDRVVDQVRINAPRGARQRALVLSAHLAKAWPGGLVDRGGIRGIFRGYTESRSLVDCGGF